MGKKLGKPKHLKGVRVYLSGPMDFVASRANEKKAGWRNRVGEFLRELGVIVFDPWFKPQVRSFHEYGREDIDTTKIREMWTFEKTRDSSQRRAKISGKFWETLHIDLRMVDTSDFTIAYCPTNIYSVGTPHEIILCRQQRKPVLFVSPRVQFSSLERLEKHLETDKKGLALLRKVIEEVPIKDNPTGVPSLWYMPLVGGENFFDGFGFKKYKRIFKWQDIPLDRLEESYEIKNPLLPFLEEVNVRTPKKWDNKRKRYVRNDDWLLFDIAPSH